MNKYLGFVFAMSILSVGSVAAKPAAKPAQGTPARLQFSADEMSLLYQTCVGIGGAVSLQGSQFTCVKLAAIASAQAGPDPSSARRPVDSAPTTNGSQSQKYRGASLADLRSDTLGDISTVRNIDDLLPLIKVGVTTRQQIVSALKEPATSMFMGSGMESVTWRKARSIGKTGGIGQLFTKRGPVIRILTVQFKNSIVADFSVTDTR